MARTDLLENALVGLLQSRTWWIDKPSGKASSNPTDEDLSQLRSQGFSVVISFLDGKKQPARYDNKSAADAGWVIHSVPIAGGDVPSLDQLCEFIACVNAVPGGSRILMHGESGLAHTALMAAAYWIANGLPADQGY